MNAKDEFHQLIDDLDDIDAAELLARVKELLADDGELSEEALDLIERGEDQIARGDYVTLDTLRHAVVT